MNRRKTLQVLSTAATAAIATACSTRAVAINSRVPEANEVRIGQSCQLTGPLAALTQELQQGASWYFEKVNREGGINGRPIRIIALDDAYDADRATANVRQLIERDEVFALFNLTGTPTNMAALPVIRRHGVPLIAPFTGSLTLRQPFERLVFNVRASYGDEIEGILQHLSTIGILRVGIAYLNNAFGTGGVEYAAKAAAKFGVTLIASVPLEVSGKGLNEAAMQLGRHSPQAVLLVTAGKVSSDFIDAFIRTGVSTLFCALSVISSQQLIAALGDKSRGIAIAQVMPYAWGGRTSLARQLGVFAKTAGPTNVTYNHMEGFVSAKVLVEGLRLSTTPTREGLIRALETFRNLDLGGYDVRFSPLDHNGSKFVELTIVDGRKQVLR